MTTIQQIYEDVKELKDVWEGEDTYDGQKNKIIQLISKNYYTSLLPIAKKQGKDTMIHYEICVWGHIHNLNKEKAIKSLKTFEKQLSEVFNGIMFDGKKIESYTLFKGKIIPNGSNEEQFRQSCENQQCLINVFKIMISML